MKGCLVTGGEPPLIAISIQIHTPTACLPLAAKVSFR